MGFKVLLLRHDTESVNINVCTHTMLSYNNQNVVIVDYVYLGCHFRVIMSDSNNDDPAGFDGKLNNPGVLYVAKCFSSHQLWGCFSSM